MKCTAQIKIYLLSLTGYYVFAAVLFCGSATAQGVSVPDKFMPICVSQRGPLESVVGFSYTIEAVDDVNRTDEYCDLNAKTDYDRHFTIYAENLYSEFFYDSASGILETIKRFQASIEIKELLIYANPAMTAQARVVSATPDGTTVIIPRKCTEQYGCDSIQQVFVVSWVEDAGYPDCIRKEEIKFEEGLLFTKNLPSSSCNPGQQALYGYSMDFEQRFFKFIE